MWSTLIRPQVKPADRHTSPPEKWRLLACSSSFTAGNRFLRGTVNFADWPEAIARIVEARRYAKASSNRP
jgi:hypothetical protein